jgi:hypothetical protein
MSHWSLEQLRLFATPGLRHFLSHGEPHPVYIHDDGRVVRLAEESR